MASMRFTLYTQSARHHLELKQFDQALRDSTIGLRDYAWWVDGLKIRCKALIGLERWATALAECTRLLKSKPRDTGFKDIQKALEQRIKLAEASTESTEDAIITRRSIEGQLYLAVKTFDSAEAVLSDAISLLATVPVPLTQHEQLTLYLCRDEARVNLDKFEEALADVQDVLALDGASLVARRLGCRCLVVRMCCNRSLTTRSYSACRRVLIPLSKCKQAPRRTLRRFLQVPALIYLQWTLSHERTSSNRFSTSTSKVSCCSTKISMQTPSSTSPRRSTCFSKTSLCSVHQSRLYSTCAEQGVVFISESIYLPSKTCVWLWT